MIKKFEAVPLPAGTERIGQEADRQTEAKGGEVLQDRKREENAGDPFLGVENQVVDQFLIVGHIQGTESQEVVRGQNWDGLAVDLGITTKTKKEVKESVPCLEKDIKIELDQILEAERNVLTDLVLDLTVTLTADLRDCLKEILGQLQCLLEGNEITFSRITYC